VCKRPPRNPLRPFKHFDEEWLREKWIQLENSEPTQLTRLEHNIKLNIAKELRGRGIKVRKD
jgi:hypothetical protein